MDCESYSFQFEQWTLQIAGSKTNVRDESLKSQYLYQGTILLRYSHIWSHTSLPLHTQCLTQAPLHLNHTPRIF